MPSPRPEPLERRVAKGNTQRRPLPKAPERVTGEPVMPEDLSDTSRAFWERVVPLLRGRGQLSLDSEHSLIAMCRCWGEWDEIRKDIDLKGRWHTAPVGVDGDGETIYGFERARPAVAAFADCDRRLKGWLIEFGLTDASRGKVVGAGPESPAGDPLSRYGLN